MDKSVDIFVVQRLSANRDLLDFLIKTDNEARRKPLPRKKRDWEGFMKRRVNR